GMLPERAGRQSSPGLASDPEMHYLASPVLAERGLTRVN
ncbi:hypothetical protein A2U01_0066645, partial [Trifolium medium]|nr:hypothetical protein [Trifolium medium]